MSQYGYFARDSYPADRGYPGAGGYPRPYDPSPPSRSQPPPQPQQLVYPQHEQIYRAYNQPAPAPQPSTRDVRIVYYDPKDPSFQPPVPAPVPVPAPLPAAPRPSYVEMPASGGGGSNQFREGDMFRVVAIQENKYQARPQYRYLGGYDEYAPGPPQRGGGQVGYPSIYYQ